MMQNFEINSNQIDKIKKITVKEKNFRIKNLELFKAVGFPNKRLEDWKFSDFKNIIDRNFEKLDAKKVSSNVKKIEGFLGIFLLFIISTKSSLESTLKLLQK